MKKRKVSLQKCLLCALLIVGLCLCTAVPVFAVAGAAITGTEASPAQAAAAKLLKMPAGTTTPAATFTFNFTKISLDGNEDAEHLAGMPDIPSKNISFSATDAGTTSGGVKSVAKETSSLFASVVWPHAGVYIYSLTEHPDTYTITDSFKEQMSYSQANYELAVYVKDGTSGLYVSAIAASIEAEDAANQGSDLGDKVDPTPGGSPLVEGDYSKMIFTNDYTKTNGGTNPDDTVLTVSKEVTGDFANRSKYFQFNITVNNPATITGNAGTYRAYVLDENDNNVTTTDNANSNALEEDITHGVYIEFASGAEQIVHLKHGQRLSFTDLPVGAGFAVKEAATVGYTPSYILTVNGDTGNKVDGTDNTDLYFNTQYIGEGANTAAFTNTSASITPTGISMDTLPYIVLIGVVMLGVVVFVLAKCRRNKQYRENQ